MSDLETVRGMRAFLVKAEEQCLIWMMALVLALVFGEVVLRYLHLPLFWAEELTRYLFIWIIMIGSVVAVDKKMHFNVEFVVGYFPKDFQRILFVLENLLIILFLIVLGYKGIAAFHSMSGVRTPALALPQFLPFAVIPVAAFLMLIHLVLSLIGAKGSKEKG